MDADVERAASPEDLSRLIVARLNTGDVEGLVAPYESDAVRALPDGGVANGSKDIRGTFQRLLEGDHPSNQVAIVRPCVPAGWLSRRPGYLTEP